MLKSGVTNGRETAALKNFSPAGFPVRSKLHSDRYSRSSPAHVSAEEECCNLTSEFS